MENKELLNIKDLSIQYQTDDGICYAVNKINLMVKRGETVGLVGETGAGKTTVALGIMGLVPDPPGKVMEGSITLAGEDLLKVSDAKMRSIRGKKISMIFQDPMTALNPIDKVGDQIQEVLRLHNHLSKTDAAKKACELLELVGIPAER